MGCWIAVGFGVDFARDTPDLDTADVEAADVEAADVDATDGESRAGLGGALLQLASSVAAIVIKAALTTR